LYLEDHRLEDQQMHCGKLTIAVATAGAGVICLAPVAHADGAAPNTGTDATPGVPKVTLEIIPCIKVGAPGGRVVLEIHPCIKVGAPAAPNVIEHNPNIVVRSSDGRPQ
jgi:hypothetical protein